MRLVSLTKSSDPKKKYDVILELDNKKTKKISFGAEGYQDFILSGGDEKKKNAYIARHAVNEDWTKDGILTPGFWSRWILWNKPTLKESISDTKNRFNI